MAQRCTTVPAASPVSGHFASFFIRLRLWGPRLGCIHETWRELAQLPERAAKTEVTTRWPRSNSWSMGQRRLLVSRSDTDLSFVNPFTPVTRNQTGVVLVQGGQRENLVSTCHALGLSISSDTRMSGHIALPSLYSCYGVRNTLLHTFRFPSVGQALSELPIVGFLPVHVCQ